MKLRLLAGLASVLALLALSPSAEAFYARSSTVLNGSTNIVSVPFPYLQQSDVLVTVNNTPVVVTWPTPTTVLLPQAASAYSGKVVNVTRATQIASPDVVFVQGALNPLDLNTMSLQTLYAQQEIQDAIATGALSGAGGGGGDGLGGYSPNGDTTILATIKGVLIPGNAVMSDSHGNLVDAGAPPGGGSGGGFTGAPGQIVVFNSAGDAVEGTAILPTGTGAITQGVGDATNLVATDQFVLNNATAVGRNLLLNGEFQVSQWSDISLTGSPTHTNATDFVSDRWLYTNTASTTTNLTYATRLNSMVPPMGYVHEIGFQTNATQSLGASADVGLIQNVEYNTFQRAGFGTSNAQNLSLSFWVNASVVGTYGGAICNNSVIAARCFTFSYTISVANAWTFLGVPIPADGAGNTWVPANPQLTGLKLEFSLGTGSTNQLAPGTWTSVRANGVPGEVNLGATLNATWYMTGAQLEIANEPTAFEHVPYYTALLACERYAFYVATTQMGYAKDSSTLDAPYPLPAAMRGGPSLSTTPHRTAAFTVGSGSVGAPNVAGGGAGFNTAWVTNPSATWTPGTNVNFTGLIQSELFN